MKFKIGVLGVIMLSLVCSAQQLWTEVTSSTHGGDYSSSVGGVTQIDLYLSCNYSGVPCVAGLPADQKLRRFKFVGCSGCDEVVTMHTPGAVLRKARDGKWYWIKFLPSLQRQREHWQLYGLSGHELETITIPDFFFGWIYFFDHRLVADTTEK